MSQRSEPQFDTTKFIPGTIQNFKLKGLSLRLNSQIDTENDYKQFPLMQVLINNDNFKLTITIEFKCARVEVTFLYF